jgi:hypothetical protein
MGLLTDAYLALNDEDEEEEQPQPDGGSGDLLRRVYEESRDFKVKSAIAESMAGGAKVEGFGRSMTTGVAEAGSDLLAGLARVGSLVTGSEKLDVGADVQNLQAEAFEREQAAIDPTDNVPDILQRGVRSASRSLATAAVAGPATGAAGTALSFGAVRANQALTEGREAGLEGADLDRYVLVAGGIEAGIALIFQGVGAKLKMQNLGGFESIFGEQAAYVGIGQALKNAGVRTLAELPEEVATELLDNVNQAVNGVEPDAMTKENMAKTVYDTTIATLITMGMAESQNLATSVAKDIGIAQEEKKGRKKAAEVAAIESMRPESSIRPEATELFPEAALLRRVAAIEEPTRKAFQDALGVQQLPRHLRSVEGRQRALDDARKRLGVPAPDFETELQVPVPEPPEEPETQPPPQEAQKTPETPPAPLPETTSVPEPVETPEAVTEPTEAAVEPVAIFDPNGFVEGSDRAKSEEARDQLKDEIDARVKIKKGRKGWREDRARARIEALQSMGFAAEAGKTAEDAPIRFEAVQSSPEEVTPPVAETEVKPAPVAKAVETPVPKKGAKVKKPKPTPPPETVGPNTGGAALSAVTSLAAVTSQEAAPVAEPVTPKRGAKATKAEPSEQTETPTGPVYPSSEDIAKMKVAELRQRLKDVGMPEQGGKAKLAERLDRQYRARERDAARKAEKPAPEPATAPEQPKKGAKQTREPAPAETEKETATEEISAFQGTPPTLSVTLQKPPSQMQRKKGAKLRNAQEIIKQMSDLFAVPIRIGRFQAKKMTAGIFKKWPEVVRLRKQLGNNIPVATHEVAHAIDKRFKPYDGITPAMQTELKNIDYDQSKRRTNEGFAEFIRILLTTEDAQTSAPLFYEHFVNKWLPAHSDIQKKLVMLRSDISLWRAASAMERIGFSKTGKTPRTLVERMQSANYAVRSGISDRFAALEDFTKQLAKNVKDPYLLARVFHGSADSFARRAVDTGVFSLRTGAKLSDGIIEILKQIKPGEVETFLKWAIARHARDVWRQGKNPGFAKEDVEEVFQKHKNRKDWIEASDKLTEWNKSLILVLAESGGLTPKATLAILESYPHYLPLKRVFDAVREGGTGKQLTDVRAPVWRLTGSGREVIHPLAAMVQSAVQVYQVATKMQVGRAIVEAAARNEGMGPLIEKIPAPKTTTAFKLQRIVDQLEEAGANLDDADMDALISVVSAAGFYHGSEPIASFIINGKLQWFQFHPELYDAISRTGMDDAQKVVDALGSVGKYLMLATKVKRAGATAYRASFNFFFNPARDYFTAMMQTEGSAAHMAWAIPFNVAKIAANRVYETAAGKPFSTDLVLWQQFGGEISGYIGQDIRQSYKHVQQIINTVEGRRRYNVILEAPEFIQRILSIPEAAPRLAEFRQILKAQGVDMKDLARAVREGDVLPMDAIIQAMHAANEVTIDFRRAGKITGVLNRVEAYSNAKVQGVVQPYRKFKKHPTRFLMRGFTMLTLPSIAYWLMHKDEDWYQELPPWLKFFFWNFKTGDDQIIRVPRPFEIGLVFSALPEVALNRWYEQDKDAMNQLLTESLGVDVSSGKATLQNLIFQGGEYVLPDGLQTPLEVVMNYDLWRRKNIVDANLQERFEPRDQFYAYNTAASVYFGDMLNMSPAKLDHLVANYTGGMGTDIARIPEEGVARALGTSRITREISRGQSIEDFYRNRKEITQQFNSAAKRGAVPTEVDNRYRLLNDYADLMMDIRNADADKKAGKYLTGLARNALGKDPLHGFPNPLTQTDLPPAVQKVVDGYIGRKAMSASGPGNTDESKAQADRALAALQRLGLDEKRVLQLLKESAKGQGLKTSTYDASGNRTAYADRTRRLKAALK